MSHHTSNRRKRLQGVDFDRGSILFVIRIKLLEEGKGMFTDLFKLEIGPSDNSAPLLIATCKNQNLTKEEHLNLGQTVRLGSIFVVLNEVGSKILRGPTK